MTERKAGFKGGFEEERKEQGGGGPGWADRRWRRAEEAVSGGGRGGDGGSHKSRKGSVKPTRGRVLAGGRPRRTRGFVGVRYGLGFYRGQDRTIRNRNRNPKTSQFWVRTEAKLLDTCLLLRIQIARASPLL